VPSFKPAYLIHGDDHGRIGERRARLRAVAEAESGVHGIELIEAEQSSPEAVANALSSMTFALGRRFIVVEGVERWKDRELDPVLTALGSMPPDTTVVFFAREDGKVRAPERLHAAVRAAGGDVSEEGTVKPWELPKWTVKRAAELGLTLDGDTARALLQHTGERQQRIMRELEKMAMAFGPGARIAPSDVYEMTVASAERRVWSLADAILAGDPGAATEMYLTLRAQGERMSGLLYWLSQRVRLAHEVAVALEDGESPAQLKRRLRMPSRAADRLISDAHRLGAERLRVAIEEVADLELASRGGGDGGESEDTAALMAIQRIVA
jgi:DNA polymerase-3 subunit delta